MSLDLSPELKAWAEAQVAAGRAESVEALAAKALAAQKERLDFIAAKLKEAEDEADREGWIDGDAFLAELDAWIREDEAAALEDARPTP